MNYRGKLLDGKNVLLEAVHCKLFSTLKRGEPLRGTLPLPPGFSLPIGRNYRLLLQDGQEWIIHVHSAARNPPAFPGLAEFWIEEVVE